MSKIIYNYFKGNEQKMDEQKISEEPGLKDVDETRNNLIEEISQNVIISKNVCMTLIFIAQLLILVVL